MRLTRQEWDRILDEYDPAVHGSAREYCLSRGLNYNTWQNQSCRKRRDMGIAPRKGRDYSGWFEKFDPGKETLKAFCKRNGLDYGAMRAARYRAGLSPKREDCIRKSVFDGACGFYTLVEEQDDQL